MKTSVKITACIVFLIALVTVSCVSNQVTETESAFPENELIGVWEITGDTIVYPPDMNQETEVNDTHLPGIMVFTKKYFSWVDFHGDALPELPEEPTDAQVAAVYNQLTALAGTYEINGSSITVPIIVSNDPNDLSGGETYNCEYALEGDVLTISWTQENQVNVTLKLKRLE
jgi:hypothetical protein